MRVEGKDSKHISGCFLFIYDEVETFRLRHVACFKLAVEASTGPSLSIHNFRLSYLAGRMVDTAQHYPNFASSSESSPQSVRRYLLVIKQIGRVNTSYMCHMRSMLWAHAGLSQTS